MSTNYASAWVTLSLVVHGHALDAVANVLSESDRPALTGKAAA